MTFTAKEKFDQWEEGVLVMFPYKIYASNDYASVKNGYHWCVETFGRKNFAISGAGRSFYFKNSDQAVMFVLRWS